MMAHYSVLNLTALGYLLEERSVNSYECLSFNGDLVLSSQQLQLAKYITQF